MEEFSGYGLDLVSAPGVNVYGVLPEGENTFSNGTSFATTYVTGIAALAKSAYPSIQSNELAKVLKESKSTFNKKAAQ
ncbi:S8 family serine peptidase [Aquibacillus sp. 3ASR75-11]|uniref:S8 family serine peptidase n=1 Tax=Terrihalobacillus insolitus TaxID=2950438 RepID=A0A9X4AP28_9BACI|nr:S8 family serine peptidase [Terrihalobacillus insolitus]